MGNSSSNPSDSCSEKSKGRSKVFFLLHRTWAVIVTDKWQKARLSRSPTTNDTMSDVDSQYSFCTCSQCYGDDSFSSSCSRWVIFLLFFFHTFAYIENKIFRNWKNSNRIKNVKKEWTSKNRKSTMSSTSFSNEVNTSIVLYKHNNQVLWCDETFNYLIYWRIKLYGVIALILRIISVYKYA